MALTNGYNATATIMPEGDEVERKCDTFPAQAIFLVVDDTIGVMIEGPEQSRAARALASRFPGRVARQWRGADGEVHSRNLR